MNKKGLYALEQLIGIIISAIVLIMLFIYFILPFFFNTSTNLNIAKNNANSIKDFIDMSSDFKYNNLQDCFITLKITNLENFQFRENEKNKDNYIYVIDSKRVYVLPFEYIDKIHDIKNIDILSKYKTDEFKSGKLNIYYDKTNQGSIVSGDIDIVPFIFSFGIGKSDTNLNLEKKGDYLILYPIIGDDEYIKDKVKKITFEDYSQNRWNTKIYSKEPFIESTINSDYINEGSTLEKKNNFIDVTGDKLIFKIDDRNLFVNEGPLSDMIIDNFLCSFNYLHQQDRLSFYNSNIEKIPLTNMKIVSNFVFKNLEESDFSFEYIGKEVKCYYKKKENCNNFIDDKHKDIYEKLINSKNIEEFKKNIEEFYNTFLKKEGTMKLRVKDLTKEELENLNINLSFNDLFNKLEGYTNGFSKEDKKNFVFNMKRFFSFNYFNGKNTDYANYIIHKNNQAYFYVKGGYDSNRHDRRNNQDNIQEKEIEYYSFNHDWLTKKSKFNKGETEFYLLDKKIEVERREIKKAKQNSWWKTIPGFKDDNAFYLFTLKDIEGKNYDIVLSPVQVSKIKTI